MDKIQLQDSDLVLGKPLPWPVYDQGGNLLLEKGVALDSVKQKEILLARGMFREFTQEEQTAEIARKEKQKKLFDSPFLMLNAVKQNLSTILSEMSQGVSSDYELRVTKLAKVVQKLCYENADAALGAVLLDQEAPYIYVHPVLCAILSELLNQRRKISVDNRIPFIAAALTQNIGMLTLQEELTHQEGPLTEIQQKAVRAHPYKGVEILRDLQVTDSVWLDTILFHHERPDGSGYPRGLQGKAIPDQARLLSLADIYSAMILPRKYRDGFFVKQALRDLFLQRGKMVDEQMAVMLIKEIGVFPPGSFVKLANNEIAVVLRRGVKKANCPVCLSVISPRGAPYQNPIIRDTKDDKSYAIEAVIPRVEEVKLDFHKLWGVTDTSNKLAGTGK